MKHTSRMSRSRSAQGLHPSTLSSPSYDVRPRIALREVVFPAPLGPIIPRMRPSSTRKSTPSSATVVPKTLRRPRASTHAIASLFLLFSFCFSLPTCAIFQELFRLQSEPLNRPVHSGPLLSEKLLPFAFQQQTARAGVDKHAETASGLNKSLVHQLLIALQDRERIVPIIRRDGAYRGQGIALLEHAVEYHRDHTVAKLTVNRLTVIPLTVHQVFQIPNSQRLTWAGCPHPPVTSFTVLAANRSARGSVCPQASYRSSLRCDGLHR